MGDGKVLASLVAGELRSAGARLFVMKIQGAGPSMALISL